MSKILREKNGTRQFEKLTRWNTLDYTLVSRKSIFAKYADNLNSNDAKLCLTRFIFQNTWQPFNRYHKVDKPVMLSDLTVLSRQDSENPDMWLEVGDDKVRVYKEVK